MFRQDQRGTQQLEVLAAFAEDSGLVPSTHMSGTPVPKYTESPMASMDTHNHVCVHTNTGTHRNTHH